MPAIANNEPFPIKSVFLSALIPAIFGVFSGLFILPPKMGFDPAAGLLAWMNFVKGGTWNTIPVPDPNNIAQTIEVAVTWWPPGQYLFLGLLNLAGLSFGHAALLLAFLCTLSGAIGLSVLGKELGAPTRALPWIAAALACSQYNLVNYNTFSGGEVLVMAIWPWVAIIAWRLRNKNTLLIGTLPALFLAGSFMKYSFAIYSLCILLFLWSERLIALELKRLPSLAQKLKLILISSLPLGTVGIIYIIGYYFLINTEGTPTQKSTLYIYSLTEILAYAPVSPLTSFASLTPSLIRLGAKILHTSSDELWTQLAGALAFFSPSTIIFYIFLTRRRSPLLRFIGITSLTTVLILSIFHIKKSSISLEDRHYQQAGALLLIAIASYAFSKRRLSRLALAFLIGTIAFSTSRFSKSTYNIIKNHPQVAYPEKTGLTLPYPKSVTNKLQEIISRSKNSIISTPYPDLPIALDLLRDPSNYLLPTYGHGFDIAPIYKGRAPQVTIIIPDNWELSKEEIISRFKDYDRKEWLIYNISNWTILQTNHSSRKK